jgi:hypothetical protein
MLCLKKSDQSIIPGDEFLSQLDMPSWRIRAGGLLFNVTGFQHDRLAPNLHSKSLVEVADCQCVVELVGGGDRNRTDE